MKITEAKLCTVYLQNWTSQLETTISSNAPDTQCECDCGGLCNPIQPYHDSQANIEHWWLSFHREICGWVEYGLESIKSMLKAHWWRDEVKHDLKMHDLFTVHEYYSNNTRCECWISLAPSQLLQFILKQSLALSWLKFSALKFNHARGDILGWIMHIRRYKYDERKHKKKMGKAQEKADWKT